MRSVQSQKAFVKKYRDQVDEMSRNVKAERDLMQAAKIDLTKAQELKEKANKQYMIEYYEKRKLARQAVSDR